MHMLARRGILVGFLLVFAGCGTIQPTGRECRPKTEPAALGEDDLAFAGALADYSRGLICQDSAWFDPRRAAEYFLSASRRDPSATRLYANAAVMYLFMKDVDKALAVLETECRFNPNHRQGRIDLAVTSWKAGRLDDAVRHFERVIAMSPKDARLYGEIAAVHFQRRDGRQAARWLEKGIRKADQPAILSDISYDFGNLFETMNKPADALRFYRLAATRAARRPEPFIKLAARQIPDNPAGAIRDLDRAMTFLPEEPRLPHFLGLIHLNLKQYDQAIRAFEKSRTLALAVPAGPEDPQPRLTPQFYLNYGSACERAGHFDKAVRILRECLSLYPDTPDALNYLAYMWAEKGVNLDEGLTLITRALKFHPENGAYLDTLGWIYYKQKKYREALEHISRANELLKGDPTVTDHMGDIFFAMDDKHQALAHWKQSLILDPENKDVAAKLEKSGVNVRQVRREAGKKKPEDAGPAREIP